jgi:hypothetical protein
MSTDSECHAFSQLLNLCEIGAKNGSTKTEEKISWRKERIRRSHLLSLRCRLCSASTSSSGSPERPPDPPPELATKTRRSTISNLFLNLVDGDKSKP